MMSAFRPVDQAVRQRAATDHATSLAVEAGAGTGKTSLLTEKYVDLVKTGRARPSEIVAMTFTEKAAAQLRDKIRSQLKAQAPQALEELDRAPIQTIHSFAASLLRERPLEAGLDPNFEQLDEVAAQLFVSSAYQRWLPDALAGDSGPVMRALAAGFTLERIRDLALALHSHRDLLAALPTPIGRPQTDRLWNDLLTGLCEIRRFAQAHCSNPLDEGYQAIEGLHRELEPLADFPTEAKERALLTRVELLPKRGTQKNWTPAERGKEFKQKVEALAERTLPAIGRLREHLFAELLAWAARFSGFAREEMRNSGKVDFDDLLLLSAALLRKRRDVRDYFRRRFKFLLVDEFQDTDPLQAEIAWRLCADGEAQDWRDLPLAKGKLFLVGDPKQSIYRFRRADIDVYRALVARIERQGRRAVICQNFRTSPPLVAWINAVLGGVLGEGYEPLAADPAHPADPERKPVVLLEAPVGDARPDARAMRLAEAEAVAAYLRDLFSSGRRRVYDAQEKQLRPVRPGDVALLFHAATDIDLYEEQLRRYDLRFSLEGGHLFYYRAEVHGVLAALEAVERPTDPVAVVAALRSVLFGLSDEHLLELAQLRRDFDYRHIRLDVLNEPLRTSIRTLQQLHPLAFSLAPSRLILELYEKAACIPAALAGRHGEQASANLEKVHALARSVEERGGRTAGEFVRWARQRAEEADRLPDSASAAEPEDRIRLLTIHKAKGLEFPVVVLPNLASARDQGENLIADRLTGSLSLRCAVGKQTFETADFRTRAEEEKEKRLLERRRLLYVAVTRARDLLVVPRFIAATQRSSAMWNLLEPHWEKGASWVETQPFAALPLLGEKEAAAQRRPAVSPEIPVAQRERLAIEAMGKRSRDWIRGLPIRTASELAAEREPAARRRIARTLAAGRAAAVGSAFHEVMERLDPGTPSRLSYLSRNAALKTGFPEIAAEVEELALRTIRHPFFNRVREAERIFREIPFTFRSPETGENALYEGVVDLILEEADGLVVVDYKTDGGSEADLPSAAARYAPQLQLYCRALAERSGKPVKEAFFFFVRPGRAVPLP